MANARVGRYRHDNKTNTFNGFRRVFEKDVEILMMRLDSN